MNLGVLYVLVLLYSNAKRTIFKFIEESKKNRVETKEKDDNEEKEKQKNNKKRY